MKRFLLLALLVITLAPAFAQADPPASTPTPTQPQTRTPSAQNANAVTDFKAIVPINGITNSSGGVQLTFPGYIKRLFEISIGLSAMLAVLMFIYGGFEYMTAEAVGGKTKGMERLRSALTGLFLLLAVVVILQVINPCLLDISLLAHPVGESSDSRCSPTAALPSVIPASDQNANTPTPSAFGEPDGSGRRQVTPLAGWSTGDTPRACTAVTASCQSVLYACRTSASLTYERNGDSCLSGETTVCMCPADQQRTSDSQSGGYPYDVSTSSGTLQNAAGACPSGSSAGTAIPVCVGEGSSSGTQPSGTTCTNGALKYFCPAR